MIDGDVSILEKMFIEYFHSGKSDTRYGVEVLSLNNEQHVIAVKLTFLKEQSYCCGEVSCHFKANWDRIRQIAAQRGLVLNRPLTIGFLVIVEAGSIIDINKAVGRATISKNEEYTETFNEQT